jgi:hypothetical protein
VSVKSTLTPALSPRGEGEREPIEDFSEPAFDSDFQVDVLRLNNPVGPLSPLTSHLSPLPSKERVGVRGGFI